MVASGRGGVALLPAEARWAEINRGKRADVAGFYIG